MNVPERKKKLQQIQDRLDVELPKWVSGNGSLAPNGGFDITMRIIRVCDTEMSQIIQIVDDIMEEEGFVEGN